MKIAAQIVGALGGAVLAALGTLGVISGASTGSIQAGLGVISILIGLCVILVALVATRKDPVGAGIVLFFLGAVGLLLSWPAAVVIFLGGLLAILSLVRFGKDSVLRPVAMILGVLGGATELVVGLIGAGTLMSTLRSGSSLQGVGSALVVAFVSFPGLTFLAGLVALLSAALLTPKHPIIAGVLLLVAGAASLLFSWLAAAFIIIAGVIALVGVTEIGKRTATQT